MYQSKLTLIDTEKAIKDIKSIFEDYLSDDLNLLRVSAPLLVQSHIGLNDNLCEESAPVVFNTENYTIEVVQSLAKWKRMALYKYEIPIGAGIYTDMNAIRPCEKVSNIHSFYVDQWDWEKVISYEDKNIDTLKKAVHDIYSAIIKTENIINNKYPQLRQKLPAQIQFIDSQELEDMFPSLTPIEREYEITKMYGAIFIMRIGHNLISCQPHDRRAADYDDWSLNGDILFYHEPLDIALEISSMGIRVDATTLEQQLTISNQLYKKQLDFHKMILNEVLPLSIGGGVGQSRLAMFLLEKIHIGEVQVSVWSEEIIKDCVRQGIFLL